MNDLIKKYIKQHHLQLTTLTPVAIRTDEVLSPLVDYHIDGKRLHYLNIEKLSSDLIVKNWIDDYEDKVFQYTQQEINEDGVNQRAKRKNNFIANFLENRKTSVEAYFIGNPVTCNLLEDDEWVQLRPTIKTKGKAYIPASSIKGAIRTAVLYDWLVNTNEGKNDLKRFIEVEIGRLKDLTNINEEILKLRQDKELNKNEKQEKIKLLEIERKKFIDENTASILNSIVKFESEILDKVFDIKKDTPFNSSRLLKLSDTKLFKEGDTFVSSLSKKYRETKNLKEKREKKKKEFKTSFQELLNVGLESSFSIDIPMFGLDWKVIDKDAFFAKKLLDPKGLSNIFSSLKLLSLDYLNFELERFNDFRINIPEAFNEARIEGYEDSLIDIRKQIQQLKKSESIFCIGFGKSFFSNTAALAIRKHYQDDFNSLMDVLMTKHPRITEFPFSYYCITIDDRDMPLGWVKISDKNTSLYHDKVEHSYTNEELKSGCEIEGVVVKIGKPYVIVSVIVNDEKQEQEVSGKKNFEREKGTLIQENQKCKIYYDAINDSFNFNQK